MIYLKRRLNDSHWSPYWHRNDALRLREYLGALSRIFVSLLNWIRGKPMVLNENYKNIDLREYKNIAPTAALVAHYRAFTDIPYAKEIAIAINAERISVNLATQDAAIFSKCVVAFEARFKSVDAVVRKYPQITNYMEIPAGFSSRGLSMSDDPKISFLECDLSGILEAKRTLAGDFLARTKGKARSNLLFCAASILNISELDVAAAKLPDGPIAIITEGLLSYLDENERTLAATNVRSLLGRRGGVWIVTDLTRLFEPNNAEAIELRASISKATGFNPITGCFGSVGQAKSFFRKLGFKVHDFRRSDVIESLSSAKSETLSRDEIIHLLRKQPTLALEIRE